MSDHDVGRLSKLLGIAVAQAKFVVETLSPGDTELAPRRHLRWPMTVENRIEIDAQALRKLYDDAGHRSQTPRVIIKANDNAATFHRSLEDLISEISRFNIVHNQKVGHALPNIIKGPSYYGIMKSGPNVSTAISDVKDIVEYFVLQAVLTNSNVAATTFFEWATGKGLVYETRVLVGGIKIDNRIRLHEGMHFERLPDRVSDLSDRLPMHASIDQRDYWGRVLLVIKCSVNPALWNPSQKPNMTADWALGSHTIQEYCEALSIICDSEVRDMMSWQEYWHVAAFRKGSVTTISTTNNKARPRDCDIHVGKQELVRAYDLLKQSKDKKNLRIGIGQWVKSKGYMLNDVDRLIYLRTALEAVLLDDGNRSEMRFRLALHGAWLIGSNKDDRKKYQARLRKLYDLASKAVHTGEIGDTKADRELLDFGQDFCRRAILKRAGGPTKMDWEEITLGS